MVPIITDKVPQYRQIIFQVNSADKDKDTGSAIFMETGSSRTRPLFEIQYEQLLINTGGEIEKRTQKLSALNKTISEFLTTMEPFINKDPNSDSAL